MEPNQSLRTKWLTVRMTEEEFKVVEERSRQSACGTISEYARQTLMGKPIILRYHNQSLDNFTNSMVPLKKDLKNIGANFNQVVRRLNALKHIGDLQEWILLNEQDKTRFFRQMENIFGAITAMTQAIKQWSRE